MSAISLELETAAKTSADALRELLFVPCSAPALRYATWQRPKSCQRVPCSEGNFNEYERRTEQAFGTLFRVLKVQQHC